MLKIMKENENNECFIEKMKKSENIAKIYEGYEKQKKIFKNNKIYSLLQNFIEK